MSGNQEDLVAALVEHEVGVRRRRAVGAFRQHPAFQVFRDLGIDHALHCRRHQHVARQCENLARIEMQLVGEAGDAAMPARVEHQRGDIQPLGIVQRAGMIRDRDHLEAIRCSSSAASEPTLPKPWITAVDLPRSIESSFSTRLAR